ncbi:MAG: metalloregulator ArsR/SmtB family transcription factor [Trueperaceae bacterium]
MGEATAALHSDLTATPAVISVFAALGDPTRNALLTALAERGSGSATSLAAHSHVSRQAVDRHLRVLANAGLVEPRRQGREVLYTLEPATLVRSSEWLEELGRTWERKLGMLKAAAESPDPPGPAGTRASGAKAGSG